VTGGDVRVVGFLFGLSSKAGNTPTPAAAQLPRQPLPMPMPIPKQLPLQPPPLQLHLFNILIVKFVMGNGELIAKTTQTDMRCVTVLKVLMALWFVKMVFFFYVTIVTTNHWSILMKILNGIVPVAYKLKLPPPAVAQLPRQPLPMPPRQRQLLSPIL